MSESAPIILIGTGLAGYSTVRELRRLDADSAVEMYSADPGYAYSKPMLSNALAREQSVPELIQFPTAKIADQLQVRVHGETRVTGIDLAAREIITEHECRSYSRLILALGADPIRPPMAGDGADDVLTVNDLEDYRRFRGVLEGKRSVAILGAGLIGSEFANDLASAGFRVSVVEPASWPLGRLVPRAVGQALALALSESGVDWHFGTTAKAVRRSGGGYRVELDDGGLLEADCVLSAIGLRPRTQLAMAAGITCDRGIVVDQSLTTSDGHVHALGDCMQIGGLVMPFIMPIMHGARALARSLSGEPTKVVFPAMPVVVKTPALPIVVAPPEPNAVGEWQIERNDAGLRAEFRDAQDRLLGAALTGARVKERAALSRELPAPLSDA